MRTRRRVRVLSLLALPLAATSVSCEKHQDADQPIPTTICGTRIDPALTRPLVTSANDWHEYDRVNRTEATTAPCLVLARQDVVMRFRFSWDSGARDLMYLARSTGSVSGVTDPRTIAFAYETVVGTDGAISTAPCRTKGGEHFTLTLQLPRIKLMDRTHREDIEKFMRAYFPAALRTAGCGLGASAGPHTPSPSDR
ncbi:hypothetical protein [Streptomyces sp. NPDC003697]